MGLFSTGGGTRLYRSTRSAMIRSRFTQAVGGAWYSVALYHPFIRFHASLCKGGGGASEARSDLISLTSSFTHHFCSAFNIAFILRLRPQMIPWSRA